MNSTKIINGYWMGYQPDGNVLGATPAYVNKVTLFVAAPAADKKNPDFGYLTKAYTKAQQIAWAKQLQAQGAEVVMSFMDTPDTHWNDVDIPAFVQNVKAEVIDGEWGLNGIDIDLESGMPPGVWAATFTKLIQQFRKTLGPKGTTGKNGQCVSRLSVAAYRPSLEQPILQAVGGQLDWLNTMAYWNNAMGNEQLFTTYKAWTDMVNMGIGVDYSKGQSTDLGEVSKMAKYAAGANGCGMMEFALNNDCEHYTQQPQWIWLQAIRNGMIGG
jgi:hypothetical protein